MIYIDKDGKWEIEETTTHINKCLIEPSEEYILNNTVVETQPTTEEVLQDLIQLLSDKGVIF